MHKHLYKIKQWVKMLEAGHPRDKIVQYKSSVKHNWMTAPAPNWDEDTEYRVALAFVEGKPVFEGDELYHPEVGKKAISSCSSAMNILHLFYRPIESICGSQSGRPLSDWSWNPPKPKTITLDDLPIPKECAVGTISPELRIDFHSYKDRSFWYRKIKEAMKND